MSYYPDECYEELEQENKELRTRNNELEKRAEAFWKERERGHAFDRNTIQRLRFNKNQKNILIRQLKARIKELEDESRRCR